MDTLLSLLGMAGCNYIMGVPGRRRHHAQLPVDNRFTTVTSCDRRSDCVPAPEFEQWLLSNGIIDEQLRLRPVSRGHRLLQRSPGES